MFTNVTLLYFLLLIPLSGFIAWLGDRIGHKSGKRRHTLFGLRPRHTAMVFTVGTGMCISLVSFALMCGLSKAFRMIVSDGQRLYDTNRQYKQSNLDLARGNADLARFAEQRKQEAVQADQKRADALLAEKKAETAEQKAQVAATKAVAAEARAMGEQKKAEAQVGQALGQLAAEKRSLKLAQTQLTNVQGTLKVRSASLKVANNRVAQAQQKVAEASHRVEVAQRDANTAQENVEHVRHAAEEAIAEQSKTLGERSRALAALQKQFDDQTTLYNAQKRATDQQQQTLVALNAQVADSANHLRQIQLNTERLRERGITYQVGEEIDRVAIKPGYNVWRVEAILTSFLSTAAKKAELRGARKDKGGERALVILPHLVTPDADASATAPTGTLAVTTKQGQPQIVTEDETIRAAAASIRTANTDVVVLVSAAANAVAGEPVAITLNLYKNPIVFSADTQIGDIHINGKGTPEEIAAALYTFLHQDVRSTLLHAGVIPVSPGGSDPDTTLSLGKMSDDERIRILDRIRQAGDNARVVVTASHDMRAGDLPVPLHFDVKGVPGGVFRDSVW